MLLNMAGKLEDYHCGPYQNLTRQQAAQSQHHGKESIHSGQFMVSHFEADAEAQDEDDNEIKMPDPDDPSLEKPEDINLCTEVQLYVPHKVMETGSSFIVASHLEIETSLTKLFKCMNLAYSQKLTSPKWNHFKGVRLRWKDKIRLNNVIWRCWHMQFILKKRTPVCQFASPLDVDIHSNPQSVVLEGKYWKRQLSVIKAEYRKWRRHFKARSIGSFHCDSRSEFDFLEWSSLAGDKNLTLGEDWTSDLLFSAINVPFPFPDPREIARGASIADFIQPSLGPLQPNLDELDVTFQELLESTRLAPVPEEGAEDILKSVDYNFPAIMGSEQMDASTEIDVANVAQTETISDVIDDTNMIELNNSIDSIQFSRKIYDQNIDLQPSISVIGTQEASNINLLTNSQFADQIINENQSTNLLERCKSSITMDTYPIQSTSQMNTSENCGSTGKNILKGRVCKTIVRPFRKREPHNYDKAQPTLHQTTIYQQMLAEHQQQQIQQQNVQLSQQFSNSVLGNSSFAGQSNILNITTNQPGNVKSYSVPQSLSGTPITNKFSSSSEILTLLNVNNFPQNSGKVTSLSHQGNISSSYKPYSTAQILKKAASATSFINVPSRNMRHPSPPGKKVNILVPEHTSQQILSQKEMFRSNSLPLNSSLQKLESKDDNFAVPAKYNVKGNRSRTRSNSMQQSFPSVHAHSQIQAATSEPTLNSTLAQLLTNSNKMQMKHSCSGSAISLTSHSLPPTGLSSSNIQTPSGYQQPTQCVDQLNISNPLSPKSASIPLMLHSPPGNKVLSFSSSSNVMSLSPESFTDQDSPLSPNRPIGTVKYPKDSQRRVGHIHAEQKRRCNIKNGFDMLHALIPQLQQNPNAKLSKAAMLQKGAEYIKQLRMERKILNEKMESLRKERDNLNNSLSHLHSILPANGAPVSRQRTERVRQLYNHYVRYRTMQNWKFWILGLILEPLLNSYTTTVSMASIEELYRTALLWVEQHCSLVELRPAVSNKLRYLSTTTDILSDPPSMLQDEVMRALNNSNGIHPNLSGC